MGWVPPLACLGSSRGVHIPATSLRHAHRLVPGSACFYCRLRPPGGPPPRLPVCHPPAPPGWPAPLQAAVSVWARGSASSFSHQELSLPALHPQSGRQAAGRWAPERWQRADRLGLHVAAEAGTAASWLAWSYLSCCPRSALWEADTGGHLRHRSAHFQQPTWTTLIAELQAACLLTSSGTKHTLACCSTHPTVQATSALTRHWSRPGPATSSRW